MKTKSWKQNAATAARHRRAAKVARVRRETVHAKRERRRRRHKSQIVGAWALPRPKGVMTYLKPMVGINRHTRAIEAQTHQPAKTRDYPLLLIDRAKIHEWTEAALRKDEPMEATKAA